MVQDVVPALNQKVQTSFKGYCLKDRRMALVSKRIRDGTASFIDAHTYAQSVGENLSRALVDNLNASTLPDGRLYYNIAKRIVTPSLEENYNMVNDISADIQTTLDKKKKIGLGAVKAGFPSDRINGLIDKMTSDDIELERAVIWLREPIVNNSEAFADDFIRANAEFRSNVGLKATITRSVESGCCKWCEALAGTYDYDKAPDDVYKRHEFCRCVVTYQSQKTSQNVWSKKTWETSAEDREKRKTAGTIPQVTASERVAQAEQLERDRTVRDYVKQTGYTRATALRNTLRKDPQEIEKEIQKIQERQRSLGLRR